MRKRDFISIFSVLSVIIIAIIFFSISLPRTVAIFNQPKNNIPVGEIYGDTKIGQTFLAEYNDLSAIEVLMATYNRENSGEFIFHLKSDVSGREDIYSFKGDMGKVQNNAFFRFSFPKIENSKKKKYLFSFEAPQAQPGNAITIWSNTEDLYKDGEKIINGAASQGDLVFKTEYELGMRLSSEALTRRLNMVLMFFVGLFLNKVFYFLLFLLGFIWGFITLVRKGNLFQRKGGFFLVFGILLLAVSCWIIILLSKKIVVHNQYVNTTPVGEIYGDKKVGQTFVAAYDDLVAVDILMANYGREITGELIFHLKSGINAGDDLYRRRVDVERIKNNRHFRFKLPEIKDSEGKSYYFYVEAPEGGPGNAMTIWANDEDKYFEGEKILDEQAAEGDLVFKTVYDVGLKRKVSLFLREITRAKPFPLNKKGFYIALIGLFVLSCSLFMTFLVKYFVES